MELGILCALLVLWLVWNEYKFNKLREDFETFRELTLEALKEHQKKIDDMEYKWKSTSCTVAEVIKETRE